MLLSEALPRKYNIKIRIFTISAVRESGSLFYGKEEVMTTMDARMFEISKII